MTSVPTIAWYAPPPAPTTLRADSVKSATSKRAAPRSTTVHSSETSGTMAMANALVTMQRHRPVAGLAAPLDGDGPGVDRDAGRDDAEDDQQQAVGATSPPRAPARARRRRRRRPRGPSAGAGPRPGRRPRAADRRRGRPAGRAPRTGWPAAGRTSSGVLIGGAPPRGEMTARATMFTTRVMPNSTRPVAISALTSSPDDSGNCEGDVGGDRRGVGRRDRG